MRRCLLLAEPKMLIALCTLHDLLNLRNRIPPPPFGHLCAPTSIGTIGADLNVLQPATLLLGGPRQILLWRRRWPPRHRNLSRTTTLSLCLSAYLFLAKKSTRKQGEAGQDSWQNSWQGSVRDRSAQLAASRPVRLSLENVVPPAAPHAPRHRLTCCCTRAPTPAAGTAASAA